MQPQCRSAQLLYEYCSCRVYSDQVSLHICTSPTKISHTAQLKGTVTCLIMLNTYNIADSCYYLLS